MEWYYAIGGEQAGPVSGEELRRLHAEGTIGDDALVWSESLDDWLPYHQAESQIASPPSPADSAQPVLTGDPLAVCAWSGRALPESQMLRYGDSWVAPEYKDAFVQSLEEGGIAGSGEGPIPSDELNPDLHFGTIVVQSAKIWWVNLVPILVVTIAIWLPLNLLLEYVAYQEDVADDSWEDIFGSIRNGIRFDRIAEFWIGVIVTGGIYWIANRTWNGEPPASVAETFGAGLRNWGRVVITRILFGLLMLLLFIPGILLFAIQEPIAIALAALYLVVALFIFYVRFAFAEVAAVSNERGGSEALSESRSVTKGQFWRIVGYQIVVFGVLACTSMAIGALGIIPFLDNFTASAILSTIINMLLSFGIVEMLVLYRHLAAN